MEIIQKQLPPDHSIFLFSDLHEGTIMKHHAGVQKMIESILSQKNNYAICGGDLCEAIGIDDKRYDSSTTSPDSPVALLQYKAATKELEPIKDRLLGIHDGNHDYKMVNRIGNFVRDEVCKSLRVPYATWSAKYLIKDKDKVRYRLFVTHGSRSLTSAAKDPIQAEANMKATLKKRLSPLAGDCLVMACGHTHQLLVQEPTTALYLTDDGKQIKQDYVTNPENTRFIHPDHRWYANTGSFLKLYGEMGVAGYAERGGYAPVELGYCVVHVKDYMVQNVEKVVI